MRSALAIRELFLLVVMLAVLVGPTSIGLASSAMASSGSVTVESMASTMTGMRTAEDLPCCPEKQAVRLGCPKHCPMALVCSSTFSADVSHTNNWSFAIFWLCHRYHLSQVSQLTSALIEPSVRPPKA